MPTLAEQKTAAIARILATVPIALDPVIRSDEIDYIVEESRRAAIWTASTAYVIDDVVVPSTRNGRRYVCLVGGTSAATEPGWSISRQSSITDGTTLFWQEDGPDFRSLYNVPLAINKTWALKMSKAAELCTTKTSDSPIDEQLLFEHCERMWKTTLSGVIA